MKINVPPRVQVLLRNQALAAMGREFAYSMGVESTETLDTIARAIEHRLLKCVEIVLFDKFNVDQGVVFFEIDWLSGEARGGNAGNEKTFRVDLTKNITEQVSPVLGFVVSYLLAEAKERNVTRHHVIYTWQADAGQKLDEFKANRGFSPISADLQDILRRYRSAMKRFGDDGFGEASMGGAFRPR